MSKVTMLQNIGEQITYQASVMHELGEILEYASEDNGTVVMSPPYELDKEHDEEWAVQEVKRVIAQARAKFDEIEQAIDKLLKV